MEFELADAKIFTNIIKTLSKLIGEVIFRANPKYFEFNMLSGSKDTYFQLKIPKESFEIYKPSKDPIILNSKYFSKVLERYEDNATLHIKKNKEKNKINIIYGEQNKKIFEISTKAQAEGLEREYDSFPETTFEATIKSDAFLDVIKDILAIEGGKIELSTEHLETIFARATTELMNDSYEYMLPDSTVINHDGTKDAKATYSLTFLKLVLGCGFKKVKMAWKTDSPLILHFENEKLEFNVVIAPFGQEDEDQEFDGNFEDEFDDTMEDNDI